MSTKIRVRFAPSPTGFMHLGNVRAALLNYLFAKQNKGTFILRIEDTDNARNTEESRTQIIEDLRWLGLTYDEGPLVGGNYGPYLQSQRTHLYEEILIQLATIKRAYRCFCSAERLEKMREKQIAMGKPPRYDRACLNLSDECVSQKIDAKQPYLWRFKINEHQILDIKNISLKTQSFDMQHFADFAITRQDRSFTFIFSNLVDDILMEITHVIRGEDHLSNTALQVAMYDALAIKAPFFWHLPMICNEKGEKLSKRDFGFALKDLQESGYLPQAIENYLSIIGTSTEQEIQSIHELIKSLDFTPLQRGGSIKYDLEKLRWVNQQWILKLPLEILIEYIKPFLFDALPESRLLNDLKFAQLIKAITPELKTLKDAAIILNFYFKEPVFDGQKAQEFIGDQTNAIISLIKTHLDVVPNPELFLDIMKTESKKAQIATKALFSLLRYILTGSFEGIGIKDLCVILDPNVIEKRLKLACR